MMSKVSFADLSQSRSNNFDFLRFTLAVIVILAHSFQCVLHVIDRDPVARLVHGQMSGGAFAVNFFFALSGFLVTLSWHNSKGLADYARKRALRIYPGYLVALTFCVFIVGPLSGVDIPQYFHNSATYKYYEQVLFRSINELPGVFKSLPNASSVNAPTWTIPWEIACYGLVALLGLMRVFQRRYIMLAVFAAFYMTSVLGHIPDTNRWWIGSLAPFPRLFGFFSAGVAFYAFRDVIPYSRILAVISGVALFLTLRAGLNWTLPIFGVYLLFFVAYSPTLKLHNFAQLVRGDLSYGLYLYAYPIQQLIVQYSHNQLTPIANFAIAFLISLVLASLSWHFVEYRFLKRKTPAGGPPAPPIHFAAKMTDNDAPSRVAAGVQERLTKSPYWIFLLCRSSLHLVV
jgi:peptidoglycan/LPS O-acetylase OafA/YrhL